MPNSAQILNSRPARPGDSFITVLRVIACLLIINSHCREIYPLYFLAIGGGHGNAIFFVVSGYCLACISRPFPQWYGRRAKRILPITLVVLLFGMVLDGPAGFAGVPVQELLVRYLNRYWFAWAILLYYCVFYLVFRRGSRKTAQLALAAYFLGYAVLYVFFVDKTAFSVELEGFSPFKVYFYFGVFLAGGLVRLHRQTAAPADPSHRWLIACAAVIVLSGIVWCGEYALVMVFGTGFAFQFLIHAGVFVFAVAVLLLGIGLDSRLYIPEGKAGRVIRKIADSTLEIYLIQVTVQAFLPPMPFPLNWLVFVGVSLGGGIGLNIVYSQITNRFIERRKEQ